MSRLQRTIELCQQVAGDLDGCYGTVFEPGDGSIDTRKLLAILQSEKLKSLLTYLRDSTFGNAVEIKQQREVIWQYAVKLEFELERILKTRTPSEEPLRLLGESIQVYYAPQEMAAELRRVAQLLKENRDSAEPGQKGKPDGKAKGGKRRGRPKVTSDEAERRRKLKTDWERYKETGPDARKKRFCEDEGIKVEELQNALHWCRCHSK